MCTSRSPKCNICILQSKCNFFQNV
ncbi:MAG: hypothetical protein IPP77_06365 [Bacteroidetes bacterium]|nr:hypothetical protein [Bacteroidota bacterium]